VCANADVIVGACQSVGDVVTVLRRADGGLIGKHHVPVLRHGIVGSPTQLCRLRGLCLMSAACGSRFAVSDCMNHRVGVFAINGGFVRFVGSGVLWRPKGVACSPFKACRR
jgi:hypothetical protein